MQLCACFRASPYIIQLVGACMGGWGSKRKKTATSPRSSQPAPSSAFSSPSPSPAVRKATTSHSALGGGSSVGTMPGVSSGASIVDMGASMSELPGTAAVEAGVPQGGCLGNPLSGWYTFSCVQWRHEPSLADRVARNFNKPTGGTMGHWSHTRSGIVTQHFGCL